jgi:hypothetical protein
LPWNACLLVDLLSSTSIHQRPIHQLPSPRPSPLHSTPQLNSADRPTDKPTDSLTHSLIQSINQSFNSNSMHRNILITRRQHLPRSLEPIRDNLMRTSVQDLADGYCDVDARFQRQVSQAFSQSGDRSIPSATDEYGIRPPARCLLLSTDPAEPSNLRTSHWGFPFIPHHITSV